MNKKLTLTALFILMLIALATTNVYANYQSIPNGSGYIPTKAATVWVSGIRQMEAEDQVMGLSETIDTSTLLAEGNNNNIDVHMAKNTEYGATVILGASEYGKQGTGTARYMHNGSTTTSGTDIKASSTGNVYGVYELGYIYHNNNMSQGYYEWTAAGGPSFLSSEIDSRYVNIYTTYGNTNNTDITTAKRGDATIETKGWQGGGANWLYGSTYGFLRGGGSAFHCNGGSYTATNSVCGRAVVVVGSGL